MMQEAMESLGGNGYAEGGGIEVLAHICCEMPVNNIWEGAGSVMALDLLGTLCKGDAAAALAQELTPARDQHAALDRLLDGWIPHIDVGTNEAGTRSLAHGVAPGVPSALLAQTAPAVVFSTFCELRLPPAHDVLGLLTSTTDLAAIVRPTS